MKYNQWLSILLLVLLIALFTPLPAHADMAPPEQPPGTNIVPGTTPTKVRMVAETVTLTVVPKPDAKYPCQAATEAVFTMRNLGSKTETMEARFPLNFWNDLGNGIGMDDDISDIQIFVDGKQVSTHPIEADFNGGVAHRQASWAAFDVTFPPGEDVIVKVTYTSNGFGYLESGDCGLRYVLETGVGWNDTIGSADIIVKLPYAVSDENVRLGDEYFTTNAAKLNSNEISWHFEDFEPTSASNIIVTVVNTLKWQNVLKWRTQTEKTPNDGEAWGQLGKAIKEAIADSKGYTHDDPGAQKLYSEAQQAYEKAVTILPKDALWHYGFADLLWRHYFIKNYGQANDEMLHIANELRISLTLDPTNERARDLADWISGNYPWAIAKTESGFDYPMLTATPTIDPLSVITIEPEATSTPTNTVGASPQTQPTMTALPLTATDEPANPAPQKTQPGLPLCGGAALILVPALALLWFSKRR